MSDLISRKEVLDMLFKMRENKNGNDHYRIGVSYAINAVKFAPSIKPETGEWISVKDKLPQRYGEICKNVVLHLADGLVSVGWMNEVTDGVYFLDNVNDIIIKRPIEMVTHWMPLPEPPKGENE